MRNNARTYKIYISEAESLKLEKAFTIKSHGLETLKFKVDKTHFVSISINFNKLINIYIKDLKGVNLASYTQKIGIFQDINKYIYKLSTKYGEEYLIKVLIEQKNDYTNRKYALHHACMQTYNEEDYWKLLKVLNPTDIQELLDFCFILLLNAKDVYVINNYREILTNKFDFYGLNLDKIINPIEKIDYKEDIYNILYKMLLFEIVDTKNELINISPQMRLRRQEKIRDKVFNLYNDVIKSNSINEQPTIYL